MNSYSSSAGKLEAYLRLCIPHIATLFFILLNVSQLAIPFAQSLKPDFALMAVYYWAVYRPTLMPPAMTFVLGIILDFLTGSPAGFYALTYICAHWITRDQRRFLMGQPFITLWLGFSFVSFATSALQWCVFALAEFGFPDLLPVFLRFCASVFVFPAVVLMLLPVHRILPGSAASRDFS